MGNGFPENKQSFKIVENQFIAVVSKKYLNYLISLSELMKSVIS